MNYDLSEIQSTLLSVVKFKRDFNPTYKNILDSTLVGTSDSGLYFNSGISSLITLKNICSLMPNVDQWDIPTYSGATTYSKDEIVTSTSKYYISLVDSNVGHALNLTAYWSESTLESIWLKREIYAVIENVLAKSIKADYLFDHELLYTISNLSDTVENASNYVGFEIRPHNSEHLKMIINQIGAQFTQANTDVNIYLYQNNTLYTTGTFDNTANEFVWNTVTGMEMTGAARWFLFYNQDDISGNATNWNMYQSNKYSRFIEVLPFEVANTTTNFLQDIDGYTSNSYGLGLNMSIKADLTNFIKQNKLTFAETIQLQFGYNMLEMFYNNSEERSNRDSKHIALTEDTKKIILGELKSENEHSLVSRLNKSYWRLRKSLKFGDVALPCDDEESYFSYSNFG